jgi:hypothetical protein
LWARYGLRVEIIGVFLLLLMMVGVSVGLVVVEQRAEETGGILGPAVTETELTPTPPPASPGGAVPEGWQRLDTPEGGMSLWYPGEMVRDEAAGGGARLRLMGETQTEGTELFDGIMVVIETGTYEGESFAGFVRDEYDIAIDDPATRVRGDLGEVNVSGRTGYRYVSEGLGTFTHIWVPLGQNRFGQITYMVADPEGRDYQGMVEAMLASISYGQ